MISERWHALLSWLGTLGLNDWIAISSAAFALVSIVISRAAVRRQERLQLAALELQHESQLIAWADESITAIADAQRYCRDLKNSLLGGADAARVQSELRTRLSALLDRGRLFFPADVTNDMVDGDDRMRSVSGEAAYDGKAHDVIEALYNVYRIVSDFGRNELTPAEGVKAIVVQRRRFVSHVFNAVDPRRRNASLRHINRTVNGRAL